MRTINTTQLNEGIKDGLKKFGKKVVKGAKKCYDKLGDELEKADQAEFPSYLPKDEDKLEEAIYRALQKMLR